MSTVVRHLINDVDASNYTFTPQRIETTVLVAAQLMTMNVDFTNTYDKCRKLAPCLQTRQTQKQKTILS